MPRVPHAVPHAAAEPAVQRHPQPDPRGRQRAVRQEEQRKIAAAAAAAKQHCRGEPGDKSVPGPGDPARRPSVVQVIHES